MKRFRGPTIAAVKVAASAALLWFALQLADPADVLRRISELNPALALAPLLVLAGQVVVAAWRWKLVAKTAGTTIPYWPGLSALFVSAFFNQAMISVIAGDGFRIWWVRRWTTSTVTAVLTVFLDRLVGIIGLLIIVVASLPFLLPLLPNDDVRLGALVAVATVAAPIVIVLLLPLLRRPAIRRAWLASLWDIAGSSRHLTGDTRGYVSAIMSVAIHLVSGVAVWMLAAALGIEVKLWWCLVLVPPVILMSMLPISIAGWGVREVAMINAFGFVGLARDEALALSVTFGLALVAATAIGGILWAAKGWSSGGKYGTLSNRSARDDPAH